MRDTQHMFIDQNWIDYNFLLKALKFLNLTEEKEDTKRKKF